MTNSEKQNENKEIEIPDNETGKKQLKIKIDDIEARCPECQCLFNVSTGRVIEKGFSDEQDETENVIDERSLFHNRFLERN